jgi:hypothetical protein
MNKPNTRLVSDPRPAALEPGELLVRTLRDGLTLPPDHKAIAKANRALRNWTVYANPDRGNGH